MIKKFERKTAGVILLYEFTRNRTFTADIIYFLQRYGLKARKSDCIRHLIVSHQYCFDEYPILTVRPLHGLKGKVLRRGDFPSLNLFFN